MRALERAYLRVLIDPAFAVRLADPDGARAEGLSPDEVELLVGLAQEPLAVERSGRRRHLWDRARTELPRTIQRAEARLPGDTLEQVRARLFSDLLWNPERTLALPLYGQGFENATHIRDALCEQARACPDDEELAVLAGLAQIEHAVYALRQAGPSSEPAEAEIVFTVEAAHDLFAAADRSDEPAAGFRIEPAWWYLTSDGRVGRSPCPLDGRQP